MENAKTSSPCVCPRTCEFASLGYRNPSWPVPTITTPSRTTGVDIAMLPKPALHRVAPVEAFKA